MKKFIKEYKALRHKSDTKVSSKDSNSMCGERVTVTTQHSIASNAEENSQSVTQVGTIRTEEYKRDLAEFQARRSVGPKELPDTPIKRGRHSLPVPCTSCASHDTTFNYEKKSAVKCKKKSHKRARSAQPDRGPREGVPNIQFLFQNQVFMPGNLFPSFSGEKIRHRRRLRSPELVQRQIDFNEDHVDSPPLFYKNNSLPFEENDFLECSRSDDAREMDGKNKNGGDDKLSEVMEELKHFDQWADDQLNGNLTKSDDSKSETSAFGLPIASASNLSVGASCRGWSPGTWGVVPVQVRRLFNVDFASVAGCCSEINILRKFRHPNIILLMGLHPLHNGIKLICERCVDSLFGILHVQGRILSAQTSVHYALGIANALVFLKMQNYIHTDLSSHCIMVTANDTAKLADVGPCVQLAKERRRGKSYELYTPEPQYVNIEDTQQSSTAESEPLISPRPSEVYLALNAVSKPYKWYRDSEHYRWQAPELFTPDENDDVFPCSRSDVYSLCLVLWECCNATVPWKTLSYEKLKELYTLWNAGIRLPYDGTYPGCLLDLLESGLKLTRSERIDLINLQSTLQNVKSKLDDLEYIVIPAQRPSKKSTFSSVGWDTNSPTDESECLSPLSVQHTAIIHKSKDKDTSDKDTESVYETIQRKQSATFAVPEKCYIIDDGDANKVAKEYLNEALKYDALPDNSSACSTPITKIRARIKDIGTPGLHRSDSTEYCSILSPNRFTFDDKDGAELPTTKLSRSFTPQSYKPLHIKVPEFNFDSVKSILKDRRNGERSSYNFDIRNYSLPSTPIARSNKLRKNAWLSGDLSERCETLQRLKDKINAAATLDRDVSTSFSSSPADLMGFQSASATADNSNCSTLDKAHERTPEKLNGEVAQSPKTPNTPEEARRPVPETVNSSLTTDRVSMSNGQCNGNNDGSPESLDYCRDNFTGLRKTDRPSDYSPETYNDRTSSWSFKSSTDRSVKKQELDVLANVNVKPLVAIHERWIYEANKKTGRSVSMPNQRCQMPAVKPASHCVDTLQNSLPQLNMKRGGNKNFRSHPVSPSGSAKSGSGWWYTQNIGTPVVIKRKCSSWEQYRQAREAVSRSISFNPWKKDTDTITEATQTGSTHSKVDQATDTLSIEEFIRELIRREFHQIIHEIPDDSSTYSHKETVNKGVAHIVESLKCSEERAEVKSFSRVTINGNNKPLLQITFNSGGENTLQVLDNCVNVTIGDGNEKMNVSVDDTLVEDAQANSLKRCQGFSAIQEARSTEDLYIDDELSTAGQDSFGRVTLIPLHGSLHELLCERADDCCLAKVKQENGCDTIYFRCDNSDTESRDAIDGPEPQDTVVFKRSISLVEERIQRVIPKEKRCKTPIIIRKVESKTRPKSEIFLPKLNEETRVLSSSSPSLMMRTEEVEINIEDALCVSDDSLHEEFVRIEQIIEEDMAKSCLGGCGLGKISEENLDSDDLVSC